MKAKSKTKKSKKQSVVMDAGAAAEAAVDDVPTIQVDREEVGEPIDGGELTDGMSAGEPETPPAEDVSAVAENANAGPTSDETPAETPVADPAPETTPEPTPEPAAGLSDEGSQALVAIFGNARVKQLEELTVGEELDRKLLEDVVHRGIDSFIETGRALKEIYDRKLWRSTHKTFRDYARDTFQLGKSQGYRIMQAAEAAATLTEAKVEVEGAVVEVQSPSIKAASEFAAISHLVDTTNLSMAEVEAFTADLQQFAIELAIEVSPVVDGKAQLSQKVFQAVKDVILEAATLKAVDIEGEHHEVSAAHVAVTREVFENMQREKQKWIDEIRARQARHNQPITANGSAPAPNPEDDSKVEITCSRHGKSDNRSFKIIYGGFVLSCGCKFRRYEGEDALSYVGNELAGTAKAGA